MKAFKDGVLIDVREPNEYYAGHVDGAINIPLSTLQQRIEEIRAMGKPLYLYCQSGNRSGMAEMLLRAHGIKEVYNIGGLYEARQFVEAV